MTYGQPPEPNATTPLPDGPGIVPATPIPPQYPMSQQPWGTPGWPGPPPTNPPKGPGLAVASVLLALIGAGLPLLPIDLAGFRHYLTLPFGLAGLALAIIGCTGHRRGQPMAVVGVMLSVPVLILGAYLTVNIIAR